MGYLGSLSLSLILASGCEEVKSQQLPSLGP